MIYLEIAALSVVMAACLCGFCWALAAIDRDPHSEDADIAVPIGATSTFVGAICAVLMGVILRGIFP